MSINDTSRAKLTPADLAQARAYSTGQFWRRPGSDGFDATVPMLRRIEPGAIVDDRTAERMWRESRASYGRGYGYAPKPQRAVTPCSTLGRWWLAVLRWLD